MQVPDALLPDDVVETLVAERRPAFVPVDGSSGELTLPPSGTVGVPGHGGAVQLRLSNGIKVNYRRTGVGDEGGTARGGRAGQAAAQRRHSGGAACPHGGGLGRRRRARKTGYHLAFFRASTRCHPDHHTPPSHLSLSHLSLVLSDNEPRGAMLRLVAAGGRAAEGQGVGPLGAGVMALGTRTLSEAGAVGTWSREQVRRQGVACLARVLWSAPVQGLVRGQAGREHTWRSFLAAGLNVLRPYRLRCFIS